MIKIKLILLIITSLYVSNSYATSCEYDYSFAMFDAGKNQWKYSNESEAKRTMNGNPSPEDRVNEIMKIYEETGEIQDLKPIDYNFFGYEIYDKSMLKLGIGKKTATYIGYIYEDGLPAFFALRQYDNASDIQDFQACAVQSTQLELYNYFKIYEKE